MSFMFKQPLIKMFKGNRLFSSTFYHYRSILSMFVVRFQFHTFFGISKRVDEQVPVFRDLMKRRCSTRGQSGVGVGANALFFLSY